MLAESKHLLLSEGLADIGHEPPDQKQENRSTEASHLLCVDAFFLPSLDGHLHFIDWLSNDFNFEVLGKQDETK